MFQHFTPEYVTVWMATVLRFLIGSGFGGLLLDLKLLVKRAHSHAHLHTRARLSGRHSPQEAPSALK